MYKDFFFVCWSTVSVCMSKTIMTVRLMPGWSLLCYGRKDHIFLCSSVFLKMPDSVKIVGLDQIQVSGLCPSLQFLSAPAFLLCNTIKQSSIQGNEAVIFRLRSCFFTSENLIFSCQKVIWSWENIEYSTWPWVRNGFYFAPEFKR